MVLLRYLKTAWVTVLTLPWHHFCLCTCLSIGRAVRSCCDSALVSPCCKLDAQGCAKHVGKERAFWQLFDFGKWGVGKLGSVWLFVCIFCWFCVVGLLLFWFGFFKILFTFLSPPFSPAWYCREMWELGTSQPNRNRRIISCTGPLCSRGIQMPPLQQSQLMPTWQQ